MISGRVLSRSWAVLLLLASASAGALAAERWSLDQALSAIAAEEHPQVAFTELRYSDLLDRPVASSGTLRFEPPDRLIKAVERPAPERLEVAGDTLRIARAGQATRELRLSAAPAVWGFVESFRATLAGDRATLEKFYKVAFDGTRENWRIDLEPRGGRLAGALHDILIEGSGGRVRSFTVDEAGGDRTVMTIGQEGS